jgi:hypothetical protein
MVESGGRKTLNASWVKKAIFALWNGQPPALAELSHKDLIRRVDEWIFAECNKQNVPSPEISDETILRAAGRKK